MRSKGRKRAPEKGVDIKFSRIDITCGVCQERTGRPHRIGVAIRRLGIESTGRDMFLTSPLQGYGDKVRVLCPTCQERDGIMRPVWLDRTALVLRLKIMELQGIHAAEKAV